MHRDFIYCRKSTEDDYHQARSLESKRREFVRHAEAHSLADTEFSMGTGDQGSAEWLRGAGGGRRGLRVG